MPIKTENRARYPKNWPEIRASILERAGNRCEFCDIPNSVFKNTKTGEWTDDPMYAEKMNCIDGHKIIMVVLTIAHLDHQPENNDPANLRALCQKCHNDYDRPHRQRNAAITRQQKRNGGACLELEVQ